MRLSSTVAVWLRNLCFRIFSHVFFFTKRCVKISYIQHQQLSESLHRSRSFINLITIFLFLQSLQTYATSFQTRDGALLQINFFELLKGKFLFFKNFNFFQFFHEMFDSMRVLLWHVAFLVNLKLGKNFFKWQSKIYVTLVWYTRIGLMRKWKAKLIEDESKGGDVVVRWWKKSLKVRTHVQFSLSDSHGLGHFIRLIAKLE